MDLTEALLASARKTRQVRASAPAEEREAQKVMTSIQEWVRPRIATYLAILQIASIMALNMETASYFQSLADLVEEGPREILDAEAAGEAVQFWSRLLFESH